MICKNNIFFIIGGNIWFVFNIIGGNNDFLCIYITRVLLPINPKKEIYKKQNKGIKNPILIFSAPISPIKAGAIAPPTMVKTSMEAAVFVCFPKPFIPKAKMEGNMIDMNK